MRHSDKSILLHFLCCPAWLTPGHSDKSILLHFSRCPASGIVEHSAGCHAHGFAWACGRESTAGGRSPLLVVRACPPKAVDIAPGSTLILKQFYYVTLSVLPRFGSFTRFSGLFQMGRVPGVVGGNRHQRLLVSVMEAVSKHSVRLFRPRPAARCPIPSCSRMASGQIIQVILLGVVACQRRAWGLVHSALLGPFLPDQSPTR